MIKGQRTSMLFVSRAIALCCASMLIGCVSSIEKEVTLQPSISEDLAYNDIYLKATHSFEITKNFETRSTVTVTHLHQKFLEAFNTRSLKLFQQVHPLLKGADTKVGFLVVLYTADRQLNALDNPNIWTVTLKSGQTTAKSVAIKKLIPKENFQPFFANINVWTMEYLVLFNDPAAGPNEPATSPADTALVLSSADTTLEVPL